MLKKTLILTFGSLFVFLCIVNVSQAAKLFAVSAQTTESTDEVFRYEIEGPASIPALDLTITDPSIDKPNGVAFSAIGEMFVVNRGIGYSHGNGSISRFLDPAGNPLFNGTITSNNFSGPHWAVFRLNEMFIAQRYGNNVLRFIFDADGNALPNGEITEELGGTTPRGVTVSPWGELFVTQCCWINRINRYIFDASGNAILNGFITGGGMSNPHDMAFSPWGELFVANLDNSSISRFIFDASGNALFNGQMTGNSLNGPVGLAFSPWGELFVSNQYVPAISRWIFDASFNASPNGSFTTPQTLGDIEFLLPTTILSVSKSGTGSGTVSSSPAGITCGTDCSEAYASGTAVTLTATPESGSIFTGWSGVCTGTGTCTVTVDANKSVTAVFDLQTLPSTPSQSHGQGSGSNNQGTTNAPGLQNNPGLQNAPGLQKK